MSRRVLLRRHLPAVVVSVVFLLPLLLMVTGSLRPTSVRGYVAQTPIQVRQFYERAKGLELFEIEDEVYGLFKREGTDAAGHWIVLSVEDISPYTAPNLAAPTA